MSKYIDAEKLVEHLYKMLEKYPKNYQILVILDYIASLQQEQPEPTCKTCGFYDNNCPFIRGKFIPYPNKVCKDYIYSAIKEQEQESVAERFARIVRGNLIGIDKEVQQKFEQLYFEVTGNKMYGGYND